jgi:hypothetical protein
VGGETGIKTKLSPAKASLLGLSLAIVLVVICAETFVGISSELNLKDFYANFNLLSDPAG